MTRRELLLWSIGLGLSPPSRAESKTYMVEIAIFTCPHCLEVDGYVSRIESEIGDEFRFAPVTERTTQYPELAWYALRTQKNAAQIRRALFQLHQSLRVMAPQQTEVTDWLALNAGVNQDELDRSMASTAVRSAYERGVRLAVSAGVTSVPAFVFVREGQVLGILEKGSMQARDFVDQGLMRHRQFKGVGK